MTRPLVIGDNGGVGRIVADKNSVAVRPTAISLNPLLHRSRRNKSNFLRSHVISQISKRNNIVDDPDAAAMSGQDEVVLPGLNCQIPDGHRWKMVAFELSPVFSAIDRHP